ncbi:BCCT family transporter [Pseudoflavonifractor sp. MCC625]|uniref:BCCT family transporter n=1 Tax=Pseudoflavonifractor sp. MCC625 TaxID=2592647 RepID=UPI001C0379D9|nr:BCCT family transporter [Pseudoflavonifractor sp. MCC625]MBT9683769.1 BCCT family transporter [Pseudoflavonifractor sp. MCC625]
MNKPKREKNITYTISVILIVALVLWAVLSGSLFEAAANTAFTFLSVNFSWLYMLAMSAFVIFSIWIGFFSKYRKIRLGADDARPEYSNAAWFGMLFSAGAGIGLVFWGVAEPLSVWAAPPGIEPGSAEATRFAFQKAFLHWGLHPWAAYCVLGLGMAYFQFRKGKPGLVSSVFPALAGDNKTCRILQKGIDILAIFATAAGIATSLGLGAMQIDGGLNAVFGLPKSKPVLIATVVIITIACLVVTAAGMEKGIKRIGNLNNMIVGLLAVCGLLLGPTREILCHWVEGLGVYIQTLPSSALETGSFSDTSSWYGKWTVFYWAWWIAWAPFIGGFIARISKGRTVQEFIAGVLFLPSSASLLWFSIFGSMGIDVGREIGVEAARELVSDTAGTLFAVLRHYPLSSILSVVFLVLLCTFFITSFNSATFVLGMLSSNGDLNPPLSRKLVWGVLQAALALVLMVCTSKGLDMLQTMSIVSAFPFAFILIFTMVSVVQTIRKDPSVQKE